MYKPIPPVVRANRPEGREMRESEGGLALSIGPLPIASAVVLLSVGVVVRGGRGVPSTSLSSSIRSNP